MENRDPARDIDYHIQELRSRIIHSFIVLVVLTAIGFYLSGDILSFLQADLTTELHALNAYETIYTQIMIAVMFGFFAGLPAIIYQLLKFAEPGLRDAEYKVIRNFLPFSFILFVIGGVFAYEFIVKTSLQFFMESTKTADVTAVWGLQNTLGFALKLSIITGVLFQLPIVSIVLAKAGLINAWTMKKYRGYFIVGILVASAVATPPDIITQLLITAPIIGLYQLSIFLVSRIEPV